MGKEKIMQIELYNNFVRFLARLAEYVVSLLRTANNSLSEFASAFSGSAVRRRSIRIKVVRKRQLHWKRMQPPLSFVCGRLMAKREFEII